MQLQKILLMMFSMVATFVVTSTVATDVYVSPTGSDSNAGSRSAPFKTLTKASTAVHSGDVGKYNRFAIALLECILTAWRCLVCSWTPCQSSVLYKRNDDCSRLLY